MKKQLLAALIAATFAAPALADNATLAVSATVSGTCKFTTNNFSMNFGTLDPSVVATPSVTTPLTYKCTSGVAPSSFSFDGVNTSPTTVNIVNGAFSIPVSLSWTIPAGTGSGFGAGSTSISMDVTGDMNSVNYANKPAGAYTKNVAVVVAP